MKQKRIIKKRIALTGIIGVIAIFTIPLNVKAKSLEDSFYSGASIFPDGYEKSHKECWAGTDGYYGMHYIRAMVGKGDECMADTGRCYDNGNIKRTAKTETVPCHGFRFYFPTAYAYYGTP